MGTDASQVHRLAARLAKLPSAQRKFAGEAVMTSGIRGLALVKRNASGRPGPRVRTGDYRRSLNMRFYPEGEEGQPGSVSAFIGTAAPQARRLEEGFVGADSLGRVYNQPPYPHFRPMAETIRADWDAIMNEAIRKALKDRGL